MMSAAEASLLNKFKKQQIDPKTFKHIDHLQVAYEMLRRDDFLTSAKLYCQGIKQLTEKAGAADKYNLTITLAYLSIIAERMTAVHSESFDEFLLNNPDLKNGKMLTDWYSQQRLQSMTARRIFLLPDQMPG